MTPEKHRQATEKLETLLRTGGLTSENAKEAHVLAFAVQNHSREQAAAWTEQARRDQQVIDRIGRFRFAKLSESARQEAGR